MRSIPHWLLLWISKLTAYLIKQIHHLLKTLCVDFQVVLSQRSIFRRKTREQEGCVLGNQAVFPYILHVSNSIPEGQQLEFTWTAVLKSDVQYWCPSQIKWPFPPNLFTLTADAHQHRQLCMQFDILFPKNLLACNGLSFLNLLPSRVVLNVPYTGSIASFRQQAGRAGRREQQSMSIYVAFDGPLDQYFMTFPRNLFDKPIEGAHVRHFSTKGKIRIPHQFPKFYMSYKTKV